MLGACGVEPFKARSLDARRRGGPHSPPLPLPSPPPAPTNPRVFSSSTSDTLRSRSSAVATDETSSTSSTCSSIVCHLLSSTASPPLAPCLILLPNSSCHVASTFPLLVFLYPRLAFCFCNFPFDFVALFLLLGNPPRPLSCRSSLDTFFS